MSSTPAWYRDAKLGIKIHWGPASVASFAPVGDEDAQGLLRQGGSRALLASNPDGRWYLNSLRLGESTTLHHHKTRFHRDAPYERIAARFNADLEKWNPEEWVDLCREIGVRYVVMAAKDPDGFLNWPSVSVPSESGCTASWYHSQA